MTAYSVMGFAVYVSFGGCLAYSPEPYRQDFCATVC